jgi:ABC-2 type transport system permease protein
MLFIFGYGINLDTAALRVGVVLEDSSPEARHFAESLYGSPYMVVITGRDPAEMGQALTEGRVRGFVVINSDFAQKIKRPDGVAPVLVVTDGAEPNTASFVENYIRGAWQLWQEQRAL